MAGVLSGSMGWKKPWEYRKNDRDYKAGDTLVLQEWYPGSQEYTGREIRTEIGYMLQGGMGIAEGYAILSIGSIKRYINGVEFERMVK